MSDFKNTRLAPIIYQIFGGAICILIGWATKDLLGVFSYAFYLVAAWLVWGGVAEIINPFNDLANNEEESQYYDQLSKKMNDISKEESGKEGTRN